MLCVLWYSCENTVLELDHVSLDLEKIAVLTSTGKMYFGEQTVNVETNSSEKKGQRATASAPMAVQKLHSSGVPDPVVSVDALVLVSPGLDQSVACSLTI